LIIWSGVRSRVLCEDASFPRVTRKAAPYLAFVLAALILWFAGPVAFAQTDEWTWMDGNSTWANGRPGVYGTLGTAAALNIPGGRSFGVSWTDSNGHFWLFGGNGIDANGTTGFLNDLWEYDPAAHDWVWKRGSNAIANTCIQITGTTFCGEPGVYGTLDSPAAGDTPGGREWATGWVDSSGHLWLFGGWGFDSAGTLGFLNDLWEFDPSTNEWTWMGGSSTVPALFDGQPGVYGALETPAPTNYPGSRYETASWTDSNGNLWMFGGIGYNATGINCYLNDLWKFDISTHQWTWKSGNSSGESLGWGMAGIYGTLGVPNTGNNPGSRQAPMSWTDANGNLWLFGGYAFDVDQNPSLINDVWEFNPVTSEWAWIGGYEESGVIGSYGTLGVPSASNIPGPRSSGVTWTDGLGNLWLFGGSGSGATLGAGALNDLWKFNPTTNEWAWEGGSSGVEAAGVYGTLGTAAASNVPGSRAGAFNWTGRDGNAWLFGGGGYDADGLDGAADDLWEYELATTPPLAAAPTFGVQSGSYTSVLSVALSDTTNGATIYYTTDGTTPTTSSTVYTGMITVSSTETIAAIAASSGFGNSVIATATYNFATPPPTAATPEISLASGTYTSVQTVSISDSAPGAIIYYTVDGSMPTTESPSYTDPITVSATETLQAIAAAPGDFNSGVAVANYVINLPAPSFSLSVSAASLTVSSGGSGTLTLTATPQNGFNAAIGFSCSGLPSGVTCSFSPASLTPSGGSASTQLTITSSTQAASRNSTDRSPQSRPLALGLTLCFFALRWRRKLRARPLAVLIVFGLGLLSGCGGGGSQGSSNLPPAPINATVTVIATSNSLQEQATITLRVN
jgi:N-acetylneuraminic acid mutarotase